jgi:two-component system phosphate regulon response regulator PhoB
MPNEKVLVVEDEVDIFELIRYNLTKEGYRVEGVDSGEEALKRIRADMPDLVLLDLMLPGMDGLDVCRVMRADPKTQTVPVVMVTAKGGEADIVVGLEIGADDYLPKPFSPRVLIARVKAVLRRKKREAVSPDSVIQIKDLVIHPGRREATVGGNRIELTFTEFQILHLLCRNPGWVFTRSQIVDAVRGEDYPVTDRSVDVQIAGLRKKLGAAGDYVETVRGVGYRIGD